LLRGLASINTHTPFPNPHAHTEGSSSARRRCTRRSTSWDRRVPRATPRATAGTRCPWTHPSRQFAREAGRTATASRFPRLRTRPTRPPRLPRPLTRPSSCGGPRRIRGSASSSLVCM
jgi:hypothetical protein